jgi:hypothetical protein
MVDDEEKSQQGRAQNDNPRDPLEYPGGRVANKERPDEIEKFLDGEGPGDSERADGRGWFCNKEVLQEEWIGPRRMRTPEDLQCVVRPQQRHDDKHKQEHRVVQGPNPEAAAGIEVAKEVLGRPCVEEDPGDEKTGKNEKEVHSQPAVGRQDREGRRAECVEVVGQDY